MSIGVFAGTSACPALPLASCLFLARTLRPVLDYLHTGACAEDRKSSGSLLCHLGGRHIRSGPRLAQASLCLHYSSWCVELLLIGHFGWCPLPRVPERKQALVLCFCYNSFQPVSWPLPLLPAIVFLPTAQEDSTITLLKTLQKRQGPP